MNQLFRKSWPLLLAATVLMPVSAQKKGTFDASKFRPERLPQSESLAKVRPLLADPVMPRGFRTNYKVTDITGSAVGISGMSSQASKEAPKRVLGDGTVIYGSLLYSSSWAGTTGSYGIYSFPASAYTEPELVYAQGAYEANGGGCYHNGKYYWNTFVYTDEMGYTFTTFCTYDFKTKELNKNILSFINENFDLQQITNDLTYDPSSDRIFALANIKVIDETGVIAKYYPSLSEVDPYTGFVTPIAQIPAMVAIASTQSGELYAISKGKDASLYRINKSTGDLTLIGATGLATDFTQSMTFDPITGKLYWAAVRSNGLTGLYEVDVTTGHASEIFMFGNNEEFSGLYIPAPEINPGAPAAVTDITTSFLNGSLSGTMSITAPTKSHGGATLSGTQTMTVLTNGGNAETVTVTPGQKVTLNKTLSEGIHSFTAFVSNAVGNGPRVARSCYVGIDAPAPVNDLKLQSTSDGKAHISWSAPLIGRNEGYIDPAQLTYSVTRYPDMVVVADKIKSTYFTDPVNETADNYWYEVVAFCGGREGRPAYTETGIFGNGTSLPCIFSLSSKEEFDLFTVIDANNDWDAQYKWGGWMFGGDFKYVTEEDGDCAVYGYHPETAADDWLITPPVGVEAGKKYRLTYTLWTRGQDEVIEVTAGPRNTIEAQKVILASKAYNHKDHREFNVDFTAETGGNYYIGFHITSKKKQYYAFISNIKVDVVPDDDAPSAVSDLVVEPGAKGATNATIRFTAPSASLGGQNLSKLDKIEIFHGTESTPVATLNAVPGQSISWTENNIEGFVDYRIVPYANGKAGQKAETRVYVGWDIPVAISAAVADDATGHPVITWVAPTEGVNGGYIDPEQLTYAVYRFEDEFTLLDRNVSGTTYTDMELEPSPQHLVAYVIMPISKAGNGAPASTDYIVYGDPYKGEYYENFADATVHSTPWVMYRIKGTSQNWAITSYGSNPSCYPADDDGGMAVYSASSRVGDEGILVSPKLDISNINAPVLTFYFYHNYTDEHEAWGEAFQDQLIPEVMLPDGTTVAVHDPILVDDLGTGWLKYTCDLDAFKKYPYIRIALHGKTAGEQDIYVDHISISNLIANDLQVYAFTGTSKVEGGKKATYKLTVYNRGASDVDGSAYTVNLYDDNQIVKTVNGVTISSKQYYTYIMECQYDADMAGTTHNMHAEIVWADDEIPSNNISGYVSTVVSEEILPEVSDLSADAKANNVNLNWSAPNAHHVDESFEEHTPFDTDDFGGYTLIDGDKNYTWSFNDIYFDNAGSAQSFMVFNPVALGIVDKASALFPYDAFDPYKGNQVLACFQGLTVNSQGYGVSATNDDWFISPEIIGGQKIVLYAKSGDYMQGLDKFEVMYSTGNLSTSSFKALSEVITTDSQWTRHEFAIPADARYFAIHCVSEDGFILFIDDLKFVERRAAASVKHTGYRLYRDGIMIGEFPTTTTSFADNALADGTYNYYMTALYENGRESLRGNTVQVTIGKGAVQEVESNVRISVINHDVKVDSPEPVKVDIISTDGKILYSNYGDNHSHTVQPGIYMVSVDGKTHRILVK